MHFAHRRASRGPLHFKRIDIYAQPLAPDGG
jgi:hypothetical protein